MMIATIVSKEKAMHKPSASKQTPIALIEQSLFGEDVAKADIIQHHLIEFLLQHNCEIHLISRDCNIVKVLKDGQPDLTLIQLPTITESCECYLFPKSITNKIVCLRNEVLPQIADNTRVLCVVRSADYPCIFRFSDVVFVGKQAATYCNTHHISHHQFSSLYDVLAVLKSKFTKISSQDGNTFLIPTKRQAELYRKASFEIE
jgi:hypothetical protein